MTKERDGTIIKPPKSKVNNMRQFQCGVAKRVITPAIGGHLFGYHPNIISEEKHDDLTACAFSFFDGKEKAMMISLTVCSLDTELTHALCKDIAKMTGIHEDAILISCIHTHCGPPLINSPGWGEIDTGYFYEVLRPRVLEAAKEAYEAMEPAEMGYAVGESLVGINRRECTPEGGVKLGQDPLGFQDKSMRVAAFRNLKGRILGTVVTYSAHNTAAGPISVITRDWAGMLCDGMEENTGAVCAYFNGTIGDTGPRLSNGRTVGDIPLMEELGRKAAQDAINIFRKIKIFENVCVKGIKKPFSLPKKPRIPYEEAKKRYALAKAEAKANMSCKIAEHYRKIVASYEAGQEDEKEFSTDLIAVKVGPLVFAGMPFELFTRIGLRIRRRVRKLTVICLSLTDGWGHYFPTEDEIPRGGYEIRNYHHAHAQHYCEGAPDLLVDKAVKILEALQEDE